MAFSFDFFDCGMYRRGTRCEKWDGLEREMNREVLPMWVADMDFQSPPAVQEALLRRAGHNAFGYTQVLEDDYDTQIDYWKRHHQIALEAEEITLLPCVITGLKVAVAAFTEPGDGVVVQPPVYGPFFQSITANGRQVMESPLQADEMGRYHMNFADLEEKFKAGAKLMLLCNPHNPVSRVWTRDELTALVKLASRYGVIIVSDEIHADFAYAPHSFVSMLSLCGCQTDGYDQIVTLASVSKTFNLAGLQQASFFCRNEALREKLRGIIDSAGIQCGNIFALEATRAAYTHGDEWLAGLKAYLAAGRDFFVKAMEESLPLAKVTPMEGTYLAWVNMSAYGLGNDEIMKRTCEEGLCITDGRAFGPEAGEGFIRVNLGCPHRQIEEAVKRLAKAIAKE